MIKFILIGLQVLFILRFHLELSKINPHTQPASTLRKITNPLVLPLKRLIPGGSMKKVAALIIAYLIAVLILLIFSTMPGLDVLIQSLLWLVKSWILFLQYGIFIYVIGSWIQIPAMQRSNYFFHCVFEPVLAPIRRVVPAVMGIDFSPLILLIGLPMLTNWIFSLFR